MGQSNGVLLTEVSFNRGFTVHFDYFKYVNMCVYTVQNTFVCGYRHIYVCGCAWAEITGLVSWANTVDWLGWCGIQCFIN